MPSPVQQVFDFATFLEGFKKMERFAGQYFWRDLPLPVKCESDADHTWRLTMILMLLEPYLSQPIDFGRAMKMALIHDVPEMLAGDMSPTGSDGTGNDSHAYNKDVAEQKFQAEKAAAHTIFGRLPDAQRDELIAIWNEFEAQETFESRVVKAIDKLEGKLQAHEYTRGAMVPEHFNFSIKYGVETYGADPATEEFGEILTGLMTKSFNEKHPTSTEPPIQS